MNKVCDLFFLFGIIFMKILDFLIFFKNSFYWVFKVLNAYDRILVTKSESDLYRNISNQWLKPVFDTK